MVLFLFFATHNINNKEYHICFFLNKYTLDILLM